LYRYSKMVTPIWPIWMALGFRNKWEMFALVGGCTAVECSLPIAL
jgi:hypothetical protein